MWHIWRMYWSLKLRQIKTLINATKNVNMTPFHRTFSHFTCRHAHAHTDTQLHNVFSFFSQPRMDPRKSLRTHMHFPWRLNAFWKSGKLSVLRTNSVCRVLPKSLIYKKIYHIAKFLKCAWPFFSRPSVKGLKWS